MTKYMLYIIIPYRDREQQLLAYLNQTVPIFKSVFEGFRIIIIEQGNIKPFNKGLLLNVAVKYLEMHDDDEIIFQDVSILPTRNVILECYKPKIKSDCVLGIYSHEASMGGVVKINKKTFDSVNGFPTNYWGWGSESNTFRDRLSMAGVTCTIKYSPNTSIADSLFITSEEPASISREKRLEGERNEALHKFFRQCNRERKIYTIEKSGLTTTHFTPLRHLYLEEEPFVEFITVDI
ncbi:MAG: galactosyltransferase-related protein [Candidatus Thorarchaeota archaeon]|jgi:hypothetical protein